uniref:Uncharacterized protein n=1 Tax=Anguilla anguilla TaxID=7936 RepID=A0A0E9VFU9_ANGAN
MVQPEQITCGHKGGLGDGGEREKRWE